jgi:pimeloyl-ACP methyl ester carboxylesterase
MADIILIHGLWISHTSWAPWVEHFKAAGHSALAPRWPGEASTIAATRDNPGAQNGIGIDELTAHFTDIANSFDTLPIAIGHSFGGLIAQRLLAENKVAAAVAMNPAPIKGVTSLPLAQLRSALPVLGNPLNRRRAQALTRGQFRYGFGNAVTQGESDELWDQWSIPSPGKPLFEGAFANFSPNSPAKVDTANRTRGPLLITGGTLDHTVPLVTARAAYRRYSNSPATTDFHQFDGRGHSLTIDHGWREVADTVLTWLASQTRPAFDRPI